MSSAQEPAGKDASPPKQEATVESAVEHAKRAFALKKYEEAVDHYATALEFITEKFGDDAPETADLYLSYGKALLENAIVQSSVLGKEQPDEAPEDSNRASGSGSGNAPILSFSGDAEELDEDPAVDLFAQAAAEDAAPEDGGEGSDEDDAEPEDDFNAAWEVLDLARAIYEKEKEKNGDADEVKLKLADTYIALGDVSLETEKFDQAIFDYEAGLGLKIGLLPLSSRQIAEAHYKLSIVLDLTSGRLADAIVHAEHALESIESRLSELKERLANPHSPPAQEGTKQPDVKGKGKATARLVGDDQISSMSPAQVEGEIKELSSLKEDLALKVEELKTSPNDALQGSAPAIVAKALDKELNGSAGASSVVSAQVNDLTSMVVKKKKKPTAFVEDTSAIKRKAEDEAEATGFEKKPKMDEGES